MAGRKEFLYRSKLRKRSILWSAPRRRLTRGFGRPGAFFCLASEMLAFTGLWWSMVFETNKHRPRLGTEVLTGINPMKSAYLICLLAVGLVGCSSTRTTMVQVPPRMVLDRTQTIGIVRFDVEGARGEEHNVTAKFMEAIQHGQPGVPIVELGSSSEVLNGVGKSELNGEAI